MGECGDWDSATERIVKMIHGGDDPLEGLLPEGFGSGRLLEAFARQFEGDYGVELGLSLPVLMTGMCGAMQGGFTAPIMIKVKPREIIHTAVVMQFMGIAEAGQQKSTLLKEVMDPLRIAVDKVAADERRQTSLAWREEAKKKFGDKGNTVDGNDQAWEKVYAGGICSSSITDQGTPEGIRNNIIRHGGHRAIMTAEPDVLREISAYANKGSGGGSIGLLLRGWDQEDLSVDRASNDALYVREPSLPYVIMVQPESFAKYTGGQDGSDDFVDRGLFSRTWLWRAERVPVMDEFGEELLDLSEGTSGGGTAMVASPMNAAREKLTDRMTAVALRSNDYRISKGLEQAWRATSADLWMPRPKLVQRERLGFDGVAGMKMHLKVQRMRVALRRAVMEADAVAPGLATVIDPLAQRFTSHVMRMATILTLADDPGATVVDTDHMEDVATRLIPWLWSGWWRVLRSRLEENASTVVAEQVLKNPKGIDLSGGVKVLRAMAKLEQKSVTAAFEGFLPTDIFKIARNSFSKPERSGVFGHLRKVLMQMATEGLVEKVEGSETVDATGKTATARYRLTSMGRAELEHAA